jgi:hypothetical protein
LPLYLGTAISGFGGGASQVYVIEGKTLLNREEEESFLAGVRAVKPATDI